MLLLKNITIIAPFSDLNGQVLDILIGDNGHIEKIGSHIAAPAGSTIFDKPNACVSVGFADVGAQSNDPGFEHREDLHSLSQAAAAGGYTALAPFPNTQPVVHSKSEIFYIKNKTRRYLVDVYPIGAVSHDAKGKDIAELLDMHAAGAVAFSDGAQAIQDAGLLLRALQYAKIFDGLVFQWPLDKSIAPHGHMHEGLVSTHLGLPGIPSMAEELMLQRDLQLAEYAEARLHFHNISTAKSVDLVRQAKKKGAKITASVAALNLCFDETALQSFDTLFKVMPPLREKSDIEALLKGVADGTIDFITSNHTPVDTEGKDLEFPYADFGAVGLETTFALLNTYCHKKLSINDLIHILTIKPRQVLGLEQPQIAEKSVANLTLFDATTEWTLTEKDIRSKSKNNPLLGQKLRGKIWGVVNKGQFWLAE